ncbi:hypothetical protein Gbro_4004 [Gordonia bronchialis DSM 43247]|uniref:Uncharacterized protein n=1 Tax=Gordonia bronchialis (strain ATCC 25592 / DSM 43247 / BCRC 13721 / JCM 3198 / KCTC 3076 / NBRC 16047 / NCTC 10667) TaxID=526226 RepID=D0L421_GORB4|nr:hypothetical protein Gbro_4004 [Gordonia bronchialis DSM 43247]
MVGYCGRTTLAANRICHVHTCAGSEIAEHGGLRLEEFRHPLLGSLLRGL